MARIPFSLYLNILAGIIVLFNHYVTSETGDVALNKVTGAADRFYTVFRNIALAFQQTALCGPAVDSVLPHDAAAYLRGHYCQPLAQGSESVGGTSDGRKPHGGYGGSDFAFVYYQRPLVPRTFAERFLRHGPDRSSQGRLSRVIWPRSGEALAAIGGLLLRTCASWWWFRAPLKMTGLLFAAYFNLLAIGYLFGMGLVIQRVSQVRVAIGFVNVNALLTFVDQVCMVVVADFLQCIEWEAQRRIWDIGTMMMERAYIFVMCARKRA